MSLLPTALGAAVAATAATALARRRRTVAAVDAELRLPVMWLPLVVASRLELGVGRRFFLPATRPVDGVTVTPHAVPGGRDVLVYDVPGRTDRTGVLLWIHGGGLVMGTPEVDHLTCSRMARELGIVVVSVRYRLAPEHPFPAGLDDCAAALRWLVASCDELGVDDRRIAVGGGSAGGGLAASLAQRATDEGIRLAFQSLVFPMLDDRTVLRRDHRGRGRLVWTPRSNRWAWAAYLGRRPALGASRQYAAAARREDLTGLPPAWIGVGDLDLFHDEDLEYARRLREAGVAVQLHVQPGMPHGIDVAGDGPATRAFVGSWFEALRAALAPVG
ncbi:alpha/beta hydrolase [Arthrobacter sp. NEB 688]|uniref:alpha/beta hydrolase n=1 Tax=Arthrobacter sp. NEB 688 TaxID=904039 RepID=UPI001565C20A|nr:alpha/beta hydrolase [Arthrobacter sp. NEB 688]QKE84495.1 alpha/beta hydrolase [Arthrobacter sp. NEB 688]